MNTNTSEFAPNEKAEPAQSSTPENKRGRQKKRRSVSKYDYQKVDKAWLKCWAKFLDRYKESSWSTVRGFVMDSLTAEMEAAQDEKEVER